eukprot:3744795-Rhodomonas_salina.5
MTPCQCRTARCRMQMARGQDTGHSLRPDWAALRRDRVGDWVVRRAAGREHSKGRESSEVGLLRHAVLLNDLEDDRQRLLPSVDATQHRFRVNVSTP